MSWGRTPDESPPVICLATNERHKILSFRFFFRLSLFFNVAQFHGADSTKWTILAEVPLRLDGSFGTETKDQHKKPWMVVFDLPKWPVLWPSSLCDRLLTVAKKATFPAHKIRFTLLVHWPILSRGPSDVYWILTTVLPVWHQARHMVKHTARQVWLGRGSLVTFICD